MRGGLVLTGKDFDNVIMEVVTCLLLEEVFTGLLYPRERNTILLPTNTQYSIANMHTIYSVNSSNGSFASLSLLVLSLLAVGPAAADDPEVYYSIHYAGEGCETLRVESGEASSSAAVSVMGYVTGEYNEVFGPPASDNTTCAAAIVCQADAASNADCSVGYNFTHTIDEGKLVNPQYPDANMSKCHTDKEWFGDCNWDYKTLDEIKAEPERLLGNYQPEDVIGVQGYSENEIFEFIYLAFYEDDSCTDLTTIVTSLSGQTQNVPIAMNNASLTCGEASLCAVNPAAGICADRVDGNTATLKAATQRNVVYQCDTSNEDIGQEECTEYAPTDCTKSSLYANCHFRYLSGSVLGKNPRLLLGENSTEPPVETTSEEPAESSSFGVVAGWLWTGLLFATAAFVINAA